MRERMNKIFEIVFNLKIKFKNSEKTPMANTIFNFVLKYSKAPL